jgi:hypothetical protein
MTSSVRPQTLEHVRQISLAARSDTIRHGVSCRWHCAAQSACLKPDAIHMAASRVVDQCCRVCGSHCTRALSTSELALENSAPRLCVCCTWCICSRRRGKYPRTNGRNRQPTLARLGARDLAGHSRAASVCGRVGCSSWACPSATERQLTPCLSAWQSVARRRLRNASLMACAYQPHFRLSTLDPRPFLAAGEARALPDEIDSTTGSPHAALRVVRFRNQELDENIRAVVDAIGRAIDELESRAQNPPSPTLPAEGREPDRR